MFDNISNGNNFGNGGNNDGNGGNDNSNLSGALDSHIWLYIILPSLWTVAGEPIESETVQQTGWGNLSISDVNWKNPNLAIHN